ncbi:Crp/Fnr family transcriptional regulator [Riemerella columbina]|uniref:Crp/Fnr family transcriptional regulator n=1 Tax=Riemerella columbina TaxID=103810 RepID=UPI002670774E|nr:Crp/Fnr family transcriptional regulator [Riemerella columbina]WKS95351.1 Crp/Fnr family transcriptional regulator [Riemerella columbina]
MQDLIQFATQEITLKRHELIKNCGTTDTNLYYVVRGSVRIFIINKTAEHTIRLGYQGDFITALDSFISEKPSAMGIQAMKNTALKIIPKSQIQPLIKNHPERWIKMLETLLLQQVEREQDLLAATPQERYCRVLERSPKLFQEIPNRYIANYLRMSPETLSRLKKS